MRDQVIDDLSVIINGQPVQVPTGVTVAAALGIAGITTTRRSLQGEARSAFCGMGICFECRAHIDGVAHQRTCLIPCHNGMRIITDA